MHPSLDPLPRGADAPSVHRLLLAAAMAAGRRVRVVLQPSAETECEAIVGLPLRFEPPNAVVILPQPEPAWHAATPCIAVPIATVARLEFIECAVTR